MALVSIIMPVYNGEKYLREAIDSVLCQSHQDFELIIINDGSIDNTQSIIDCYKDQRIISIQQENKGQSAASNFGLSKATGEFIKFFDADDIMNEGHLEYLLHRIKNVENSIAFCAWGAFYNDEKENVVVPKNASWKDQPALSWVKNNMAEKYDMMPLWLWMVPKKVLDKTGGWNSDLTLNNDFEFSLRILKNVGNVLFEPNAFIFYRMGVKNSLSSKKTEKYYQDAIASATLGCQHLLDMENSKETRLLAANKYAYWLYEVFPAYPALVQQLEQIILKLGGSNRNLDDSKMMDLLQKAIGWKNAKLLKSQLYKFGYEKIFHSKKMGQ